MLLVLTYVMLFLVVHAVFRAEYNGKSLPDPDGRMERDVVTLLLLGFFAFRGLPVLNDTNHYYQAQYDLIFRNRDWLHSSTWFYVDDSSIWEPLFQIVQSIIAHLWANPYALIMISAIVLTLATVWYVRRNTSQVALTIFFLMSFCFLPEHYAAMRQGWAISLCYAGLWLQSRRHIKSAVLCVVLAMGFHASAVVILVAQALTLLRFTVRNLIIFAIVGIAVIAMLSPLLEIMEMAENIYVQESAARNMNLAAFLNLFFYLSLAAISWWLGRRYNIPAPSRIVLWSCTLCILFSFSSIFVTVAYRFTCYFSIFFILLLLHYLEAAPHRMRNAVLTLLVILGVAKLGIELQYRNEWKHLVPYSFYDFRQGIQNEVFEY